MSPAPACAGLLTSRPVLGAGWSRACEAAGLLVLPADPDAAGVVEAARRHGRLAVTLLDYLAVSIGALDVLRDNGSKLILLVPGSTDPRARTGLRNLPDAVMSLQDSTDTLDVALRHVLQDGSYISAVASRLVLADLHQGREPGVSDALLDLSEREREVLKLMIDGLATKAIARRLRLAVKTIEAHRARIFTKLRVRNQRQAVVLALSEPHLLTKPARRPSK